MRKIITYNFPGLKDRHGNPKVYSIGPFETDTELEENVLDLKNLHGAINVEVEEVPDDAC